MRELDNLLDTARIIDTFDSYFRVLDEQQFDEERLWQIFTPDAKVVRPDGAVTVGPANIADSRVRSFAPFEATQCLLTGHHVAIDGDTAALRANLVAIHLLKDRPATATVLDRSFTGGGVCTASLLRTAEGWRITELGTRILWRAGDSGVMR